jgi:hypothetical protein
MVTVGMVTEGMVYCFNVLGKNGHKKLKVKEDISISISVSSLIINKYTSFFFYSNHVLYLLSHLITHSFVVCWNFSYLYLLA